MSLQKEIAIIRELARAYREIAMSDRHVRQRQRFCDTNDLKTVRPPVHIEEIPWHEMNGTGELTCLCEHPELKAVERELRRALYREKHFLCDNYISPVWEVRKSFTSTGNGFTVQENIAVTDKQNHIVSHQYIDVLEDESSLEAYHDPVITAHPEQDAERVAFLSEVFGDILPVELRGHGIYYAPWDVIARLRGVEPILIDVYDRPEYLHRIIGLFTRAQEKTMEQMDALGLYDHRLLSVHCTPASVTLPQGIPDEAGTCRQLWFRTMAQMFSSISPSAHYEFDMAYSIPLASKCAYTYYGCCEPLHDRLEQVMRYPNLRKVGASPWADVDKIAEALGGGYVLSRKPNPAHVAVKLDADVVRQEIRHTVEACQRYGCPCDITLKDISTVGYHPENLDRWAKTVSEVLDEYYDLA